MRTQSDQGEEVGMSDGFGGISILRAREKSVLGGGGEERGGEINFNAVIAR